jgi:glutamate synthase domain-containing protein 3
LIQHAGSTGSSVAARILNDWEWAIGKFHKVMPVDYRRVLEERKKAARDEHEKAMALEVSGG